MLKTNYYTSNALAYKIYSLRNQPLLESPRERILSKKINGYASGQNQQLLWRFSVKRFKNDNHPGEYLQLRKRTHNRCDASQ